MEQAQDEHQQRHVADRVQQHEHEKNQARTSFQTQGAMLPIESDLSTADMDPFKDSSNHQAYSTREEHPTSKRYTSEQIKVESNGQNHDGSKSQGSRAIRLFPIAHIEQHLKEKRETDAYEIDGKNE